MDSNTASLSASRPNRSFAAAAKIYWKETKYEFLKRWRMPIYTLSVLFFPAMFYSLFGLVLNRDATGKASIATYMIATMGCYGVFGVSLFAFGVGIAIERGQGWLEVKKASPMPAGANIAGRILTCLVFSLFVSLTLFGLGTLFGNVRMSTSEALLLTTTHIFGSIPFCALGLVIGYLVKPNSAPTLINFIYLPASFLSGLWIPIQSLPKALQKFAELLPTYHFGQLALYTIHMSRGQSPLLNIAVLTIFTCLCIGLAVAVLRRDEGKLYG